MSVRRLADEAVQPPAFAFSPENARWAAGRIALYPQGRQQSAVIPLLMRAQEQEGWVTRAAIEAVAGILDMPYIRVLEVATFYSQFQLQPVGSRAHVEVCGTTPCMLRGAEALIEVCRHRIHSEPLTRNEAGTLSWQEVECLGACVNAPMVAIGRDTYEDLTPERLGEIIDSFAAGQGATVPTGPQNGRQFSAPITGVTTLTGELEGTGTTAPGGSESPAAPQEPTTKGRPTDIQEEQAPAIEGPAPQAKVSEATAEGARQQADADAGADGTPNAAMREDATGAESNGGKIDAGAAPRKKPPRKRTPGARAASSTKTPAAKTKSQGARADVDPQQAGGAATPPPGGPATSTAATDTAAPTAEAGGGERGPESTQSVDSSKEPKGKS